MEYKVCYKCRKKLPLTSEYFAKHKKSADGYDGRCKSCVNLFSKKYREKKGEQYRVDNISKAKVHIFSFQTIHVNYPFAKDKWASDFTDS